VVPVVANATRSFASVYLVLFPYTFCHPASIWQASATVFGKGSFFFSFLELFDVLSVSCFIGLLRDDHLQFCQVPSLAGQ